MLMETYGGVYVDMDMEPLRPLEDLLELLRWPECVLGQEPLEHAVLLEGKRHFICNAVLVSKPKHQLWAVLLDKVRETRKNERDTQTERERERERQRQRQRDRDRDRDRETDRERL